MNNIQLFIAIVIDIIYELGRLFAILFSYTNNILYFLLFSITNISDFFENKYDYLIFKVIIVSILLFFIYRYLIRESKKIMINVLYFVNGDNYGQKRICSQSQTLEEICSKKKIIFINYCLICL